MKSISKREKEKIMSHLFWDSKCDFADLDELLAEKLRAIDDIESHQFFSRLLTSCDWYTLMKLLPPEKLKMILSDQVLDRLFPKDLKNKYIYARDLLSR